MNDIVCETEERLREEERRIEAIGREICSAPGSVECWHHINESLEELRHAIRTAWKMGGAA